MSIVEEYAERMRTAPDDCKPGNEWDIVSELLTNPPDEFDAILEWIFTAHKGYVAPRAIAGLKFIERKPERGWAALGQLIRSDDPDDRDTALQTLENSKNQNQYFLAKPLLQDEYRYLQFEAIDLLREIFPDEVEDALRNPASH
jgi:hypothetical protein